MIARFDADQFFRIGEGCDKGFWFSGGGELVARSADEEFWLGTGAQEIKVINSVSHRDRG